RGPGSGGIGRGPASGAEDGCPAGGGGRGAAAGRSGSPPYSGGAHRVDRVEHLLPLQDERQLWRAFSYPPPVPRRVRHGETATRGSGRPDRERADRPADRRATPRGARGEAAAPAPAAVTRGR